MVLWELKTLKEGFKKGRVNGVKCSSKVKDDETRKSFLGQAMPGLSGSQWEHLLCKVCTHVCTCAHARVCWWGEGRNTKDRGVNSN